MRRISGSRSRASGCVWRVGRHHSRGDLSMSKATYPLKLPASIKAAAARLAKQDGVSLNQWIATAVAQKVGAVETAADFIKHWGRDARPEDLKAFLANAPDVPAEPGDEIPEHLRTKIERMRAGT